MVIELDCQYDKRKITIETIVKSIISNHHISLSDIIIENLTIHLSLCVSRELNGSYIPTSESQINQLKEHEYYPIAKEIIQALEKEFDVTIDNNQISYTTMYLANMNLLDIDFHCEFDLFDDNIEELMNEAVISIKNELNIDLRKNKSFYTGMTLHFYPALERLQNNQQLTNNPLKEQIQTQHQREYQCALIFNKIVKNYYNQSFNDSELAYIALHFGTVIK